MNEPHVVSEVQLREVASALLNLPSPERRAAISPLLAMIERIVASGGPYGAARPDPALRRPDESTETPGSDA